MPAPDSARTYQRDLSHVSRGTARLILALWRRIDPGDITASWLRLLPDAIAALIAGQTVAAELADPYLADVLDELPTDTIAPEAFAALTLVGQTVAQLLHRPAIDAKIRIAGGATAEQAVREAAAPLTMYARSETSDAGRAAVEAGMTVRPHATGFYRMLQLPSCARCAIQAGRFFRYNQGFERHPNCDCVHIPVQEADDSIAFDARKAIAAGEVTGLSDAERRAIIEFGADPSQVVNARRGMYTSSTGKYRYTLEGTSRRGIAGARMLARDVARASGEDVSGRTFTNLTFSRERAAEYADLLRRGTTYARQTRTGRTQTYSYRFLRSRRPTPEQILHDAESREEATRLLTNFGYVIDPTPTTAAGLPIRTPGATGFRGAPPEPPPPPEPSTGFDDDENPRIGDLIPHDEDEAFERAAEISEALAMRLDGSYGDFDVVLNSSLVEVSPGRLEFTANVFDADGRYAGFVQRVFYRGSSIEDVDGETLWAYHKYLKLEKHVQGQGFAQAWNNTLEHWYRESGLKYIKLTANIDVGGYTWARAGYDWADAVGPERISVNLEELIRSGQFDTRQVEQALDMMRRLRSIPYGTENFPTAYEVSQLGRRPGMGRRDSWIGKAAMLGSTWRGIKWLTT